MTLVLKHKDVDFGVGDRVRVIQKIKEGSKDRTSYFEGLVIAIKNIGRGRTFTVRRIGSQKIGIEKIFPVESPFVERVEVIKKGVEGVRHSKLYYLREKSKTEIEKIFARSARKNQPQKVKKLKRKTSKSKKAHARKKK